MATYNSQITRGDAAALIPEDAASEILKHAAEQSSFMQMARRLPNMSRKQRRLPVMGSLASAYFVNGDTGLKQTTEADWNNVYLNAEELAVIVPIPEAVLDDADYDIFGELRPSIVEALGAAVDQAAYYGVNAPSTWPEGIVEQATTKGHTLARGTNGDLYDDILGEGGTLSMIEEDGYMASGHVAAMSLRAAMRGLRDTEGQPIFKANGEQGSPFPYTLDGEPLTFPRNGGVDPSKSLLISGDWTQVVYAIRQDITYKVLTEAVIQDGSGAIVYNLAQQDMVALRVVFRLAWALPNPKNRLNTDDSDRFPFAVLEPANAS